MDVHWINSAQDKVQWLALVNAAMNLEVPQKLGNLWDSRGSNRFPTVTPLYGTPGG